MEVLQKYISATNKRFTLRRKWQNDGVERSHKITSCYKELCKYDVTSVFGIELKILKAHVGSPNYNLIPALRSAHADH